MSFESGGGDKGNETEPIERITFAAIRYKGEIFTGPVHSAAWVLMTEKYPKAVITDEREDGFMTSTGRFVKREEALDIADKAGQLEHERIHSLGGLLSEDLKDEEDK